MRLPRYISRKKLLLLVLALLALYVVVPRLSSFSHSLDTIRDAYFPFVGIACLVWLASFGFAALVYKLISPKYLAYKPTLLIQVASGFTNRLAPAGTGAIAINSRYLIKRGLSALTAGAVVIFNNLLGVLGNLILLLGAIIVRPSDLPDFSRIHIMLSRFLVGALFVLTSLFFIIVFVKNRFVRHLQKVAQISLNTTFENPGRLFGALLVSMAVTICYALTLLLLELAFNVHINFAQTLFVLAFGVIAATATPTPGGIGGAEAGLVAAFIAVGVSSQQALAVALAYRFLVFWLPILPGLIAFQIALHRRYI